MTEKATKPLKQKSFRNGFFSILALFLLLLFIKNPQIVGDAVVSALKICSSTLIPSLFPMMIASDIALKTGVIDKILRPLSSLLSKFLGIKKEAASPLLLGLFCGYSASLGGAISMLKNEKISKDDCEKIIMLSSIPSITFFINFVGTKTLKSSTIGCTLWIITVFSSLLLGFLNRKKVRNNEKNSSYFSNNHSFPCAKIIVDSISNSTHSMLLICAFVIFFSSLISALAHPLGALNIPKNIQNVILGSLEVTNGVANSHHFTSPSIRASICAFFLGWSGFSMHFQIIAISEDYNLSFKKYFIFKLLQGIICALACFWLIK